MARKHEFELGFIRTDRGEYLDKGGDEVNVRHRDFNNGAVGDGINDDGIAFNLAVAHLPTEGGTVKVPPGDYLLTTAFTFGSQDNVVLWLKPGVVLTGAALPTATGNNFILDWRAGSVNTSIAGTATGDITRVNITAGTGLTGTQDTPTGDHTQTLAISGYTGETSIVTLGTIATGAVPASLVTAGTFTGAYSFDNNVTVAGILSVDDTTATTSATTGSIHTDGGLGVAKDIFVASTGRIGIGGLPALALGFHIERVNAGYKLRETAAGADAKVWTMFTDGATLKYTTQDDSYAGGATYMQITRTNTTVDLIRFDAAEMFFDADGANGVRFTNQMNGENNTSTYELVGKTALSTASSGTILQLGVSTVNWASITISETGVVTTFAGPLTSAEVLSVDDTTESTSTTTGSIHTDGGVGIVKDLFVGGNIDVSAIGPTAVVQGFNRMHFGGNFTSDGATSEASLFKLDGVLTGAGGDTLRLSGCNINPQITTQTATESIAVVSSLQLDEPTIIDNLTGDITVAATLFINNAPTEGLTNAALYVNSGDIITVTGTYTMKEITTPTALADHGRIYTKTDNKLYFQDGAGVEHEVAFV